MRYNKRKNIRKYGGVDQDANDSAAQVENASVAQNTDASVDQDANDSAAQVENASVAQNADASVDPESTKPSPVQTQWTGKTFAPDSKFADYFNRSPGSSTNSIRTITARTIDEKFRGGKRTLKRRQRKSKKSNRKNYKRRISKKKRR